MKNALILHGTNGHSQKNWYPWLKQKLETKGYNVWVPDLPMADTPSIQRYNDFIFAQPDWKFTPETLIIGHSSGAVAVLGLLQALPEESIVDTCILVGAFKGDLGWEELKHFYTEPLDFSKIKRRAKKIVFIHSDNDPYCPLDHAQFLSTQLDAKLIVVPGGQHFSFSAGGEKYKEFPLLLEVIEDH